MKLTSAFFAALATSGLSLALAGGCGTDNAVVGGTCAPGYTDCSDRCVDLLTDPQNCGSCGNACPPGVACRGGSCAGSLLDATLDVSSDVSTDSTSSDGADLDGATLEGGGRRDGGGRDGAMDDGSPTDGPPTDVTPVDAPPNDGGFVSDVACVPPYDTPLYCGDCNTHCVAPDGVCAPVDGGFACAPACPPPEIQCNEVCVDPTTDPFNCKTCGNFCPTFICQNSMCVGSTPGEIVLIGHDYATPIPEATPQAKVLTNSVFVRAVPKPRVLAYERYASPTTVTNVDTILAGFGPVAITHTSADADIPATLTTTNYEVLLVYDQPTAGANTLGPLGTSWQATLTAYLLAGGVVVVLDGATATDMPLFVTNGQLLNLTAQTQIPNTTQVVNTAPGDIVGNGVASPYRVTSHSSRFAVDPPSANVTYVIFDQADNQPVVVHRTD